MNAGIIWDSSKRRTRKSFRIRNAAEAQCPGRVRYFEIVPARRCRDYAGNRGAPRAHGDYEGQRAIRCFEFDVKGSSSRDVHLLNSDYKESA